MTHSRLNSNMPVKCIILAAAIIGTLQAATWFSLSLVSILYHESVIEVGDLEEASYGQYIYNLYLRPNDGNGEFIIYPKTFNLFMYIYLVLSFIWLIASCILMWAAIRDKWKSIPLLLAFWATVTIVIAITDIILMSLIAADLQTAHNKYANKTTTATSPTTTTETTTTTPTSSQQVLRPSQVQPLPLKQRQQLRQVRQQVLRPSQVHPLPLNQRQQLRQVRQQVVRPSQVQPLPLTPTSKPTSTTTVTSPTTTTERTTTTPTSTPTSTTTITSPTTTTERTTTTPTSKPTSTTTVTSPTTTTERTTTTPTSTPTSTTNATRPTTTTERTTTTPTSKPQALRPSQVQPLPLKERQQLRQVANKHYDHHNQQARTTTTPTSKPTSTTTVTSPTTTTERTTTTPTSKPTSTTTITSPTTTTERTTTTPTSKPTSTTTVTSRTTTTTETTITPTVTNPSTIPFRSSTTPITPFITIVPVRTTTTTTATPNDDTDDTGVLSLRMPRRYQEYEIDEFQYQSQTLYTSMGIVMSIAARGYILWIVNVTFAIMLFILVKKIKRANRPSMLPAIDAYAAGPRPFTLYDQTDIGNGQLNNGFTLDENIMFNPRPMEPNTRMSTRNPLSNNRNNLNVMQPQIHDRPRSLDLSRLTRGVPPTPPSKLAKIGKSGGRITPPRNVPSPRVPYIPDPDYTPPGSPKVQPKSAMRQQSNYVL
ncbi:hypothetical protein JTB14_013683 [Gonioctena quinquepunctata]|nr:hypothetical protein JTB14_013683 [Gonioctena quinquepunctata]